MTEYDATELAYKNGYADGIKALDSDRFGLMCLLLVRLSIKTKSYAPYTIMTYITDHMAYINTEHLESIADGIEDMADLRKWGEFLVKIKTEIRRRDD